MDIAIGILLISGSAFILLAAVGLIKMPDLYMRMSSSTKAATLGVGLILIAAGLFFEDLSVASRVVLIGVFLLLTAPVAAHMIGRAGYRECVPLWKGTKHDDLKAALKEQEEKQ